MSKFRKVHLLGAGVITPALLGHPQDANARSVDADVPQHQEFATILAEAKEKFFREALLPSSVEKLKMGGNHIRLAQTRSKTSAPGARKSRQTTKSPGGAKGTEAGMKVNTSDCPILKPATTRYTPGCFTANAYCGK